MDNKKEKGSTDPKQEKQATAAKEETKKKKLSKINLELAPAVLNSTKFKTTGATVKLKLSLVMTEKRHSSSYEMFAEGCEPVKGTISVSLKEFFSF
ncbi:hypothetical protein ACTFO4_29365 [Bacillus cereus group sp. MYBKT14-1]|uniref:hypothetical protein n=1 Tax=unclassified Bacillus cereus group TaxID=2750818 RepID=UPI003F79764B